MYAYVRLCLCQVVAEMAAIGFGLDKDAFTSLMKQVIPCLQEYVDNEIFSSK